MIKQIKKWFIGVLTKLFTPIVTPILQNYANSITGELGQLSAADQATVSKIMSGMTAMQSEITAILSSGTQIQVAINSIQTSISGLNTITGNLIAKATATPNTTSNIISDGTVILDGKEKF